MSEPEYFFIENPPERDKALDWKDHPHGRGSLIAWDLWAGIAREQRRAVYRRRAVADGASEKR